MVREGGFAAAGFTDEPEHLASPEFKADPVHRLDGAGAFSEDQARLDREMGLHVADLNGRFSADGMNRSGRNGRFFLRQIKALEQFGIGERF